MAKTQAEQIRELTATLTRVEAQLQLHIERVAEQSEELKRAARRDEEFIAKHAANEALVAHLRAEVATLREELRRALDRLAAGEAKNALLEERSRGHEKTTDRGFNFLQAFLISVVSMTGGALLSQLFKK